MHRRTCMNLWIRHVVQKCAKFVVARFFLLLHVVRRRVHARAIELNEMRRKKKNDSQSFKTYKYYNIIAVEKLCSNNRKCVCDEVHDCNSRAMRTNIINDLTAHCVCAASTQNWIHSHTDAVHHHQPTEFHVERIAKKIVWHVCDKNWRREIWRRQISGMIDGQSAYVFDSPSPPYRLPRPTLHAGQMPIEIFARRQTGRAHNRRVVIYSA